MLPAALRYKVYIVDDSAVQRSHAAGLCKELGLDVIALANDGLEALLALKNGSIKPELLLLDLEMPGLDGIGLLRELVRLKISLHIIVMSTRENPLLAAVERMGEESGLQILAALQKPVAASQLENVLLQSLSAATSEEAVADFTADELQAAFHAGQIQMRYQPVVHLHNGLVHGLSAEPCWLHPTHGVLRAKRFIERIPAQVSDETLYQLLLDTVLLQARHWLQRGLKLSVQLQLPTRLLRQRFFANLLQSRLETHDLRPDMLQIRIGDWSEEQDAANLVSQLGQLRLMGFGVAVADRGNGFTWLEELASVPFNEFQLDEGFMRRASQRELTRIILESMIQLAHRLELKTLAPGLDSDSGWHWLQAMGCDYASGPLIGPLLTDAEVVGWIRENSERLRNQAKAARNNQD